MTVVFDDAASGQLAQGTPWGTAGSTVMSRPVNYDPPAQVDVFPSPAPTPSVATTLSTFDGTDANGTWSLYVVSDGAPDTGTIAGGCLDITATDTTAPTVTIDQAAGQDDPTSASPIDFTAVFSKPVSGFDTADVVLSASTAGGPLVATVTDSGDQRTYDVSVSGMSAGGTWSPPSPPGRPPMRRSTPAKPRPRPTTPSPTSFPTPPLQPCPTSPPSRTR